MCSIAAPCAPATHSGKRDSSVGDLPRAAYLRSELLDRLPDMPASGRVSPLSSISPHPPTGPLPDLLKASTAPFSLASKTSHPARPDSPLRLPFHYIMARDELLALATVSAPPSRSSSLPASEPGDTIGPCWDDASEEADSVLPEDSASQVTGASPPPLAPLLTWVQHHIPAPDQTAVARYALTNPDLCCAVLSSAFADKGGLLRAMAQREP